ncbi:MAG TPA: hypothetical protein VF020_05440 [Chthoniobacterales bacterium]
MEPRPREIGYLPIAGHFVLVLVVVLVLDSDRARCWRAEVSKENKADLDSPPPYDPILEDEYEDEASHECTVQRG